MTGLSTTTNNEAEVVRGWGGRVMSGPRTAQGVPVLAGADVPGMVDPFDLPMPVEWRTIVPAPAEGGYRPRHSVAVGVASFAWVRDVFAEAAAACAELGMIRDRLAELEAS